MPIYKIQAGRIITVTSTDFVGDKGTIFYDETLGDLRIGDGVTPGGRLITTAGSGSSSIVGVSDSSIDLPVTYDGDIGDSYVVLDTGILAVWDGNNWRDSGKLIGYTGSQGDVGYTGSQGDVGFTGSAGYTGSIGYTGSQGEIGYTGSQGPSGPGVDLSAVAEDILPADDLTYDLGSIDKQWRSLYLGTSTIYLGGIPLTIKDTTNTLYINNRPVVGAGSVSGLVGSTSTSVVIEQNYNIIPETSGQQDIGSADAKFNDLYLANIISLNSGTISVSTTTGFSFLNENGDPSTATIGTLVLGTGTATVTIIANPDGSGISFIDTSGNEVEVGTGTASGGTVNITSGTGVTIEPDPEDTSTYIVSIGQDVSTTSNVTFANAGVTTISFPDGSVQRTKAPQMYTNADAALGLTLDDLYPGDYYYDDFSESIYIMVDTGLGYFQLLDLTVRA